MNWLSRVWELVLKPDGDFLGAIIGAVASGVIAVVGTLVGARLGGKWTLAAAEHAAALGQQADQARMRRDVQQQAIAFVWSVQAEVESLYIAARKELLPAIDAADDQRGLTVVFELSSAYFIVYPANAIRLGSVEDLRTRKAIVKFYVTATTFVDVVRRNSALAAKADQAVRDYWIQGGNLAPKDFNLRMSSSADELRINLPEVRQAAQDLKAALAEFYETTNSWLAAKGEVPYPPPQFIG